MTGVDYQQTRVRLEQMRGELQEAIEGTTGASKTVELDGSTGRLTRMDALQQQSMAQANKAQLKLRLQLVEAALARPEDEYGLCRSCEEDINPRRLAARPEAAFCVNCQKNS